MFEKLNKIYLTTAEVSETLLWAHDCLSGSKCKVADDREPNTLMEELKAKIRPEISSGKE